MTMRPTFPVATTICIAVISLSEASAMYRLLLTLCLGELVFPAIVAAAAAPPATPTAETRAKIEAQRRKIAAVPVPAKFWTFFQAVAQSTSSQPTAKP